MGFNFQVGFKLQQMRKRNCLTVNTCGPLLKAVVGLTVFTYSHAVCMNGAKCRGVFSYNVRCNRKYVFCHHLLKLGGAVFFISS